MLCSKFWSWKLEEDVGRIKTDAIALVCQVQPDND